MIKEFQHNNYKRNYQIALIFSISALLILFVLFPRVQYEKKTFEEVVFDVVELNPEKIPQIIHKEPVFMPSNEVQKVTGETEKQLQITSENLTNDANYTADIHSLGNEDRNISIGLTSLASTEESNPNSIIDLDYSPKQILEVLPQQTEDEGEIKLLLRIGKDGKVKDHVVVLNTTENSTSLKNVLEAVYNSRWQPVSLNGNLKEYRIIKSYQFR
ncbi:MAG: hypothetical protein HXY49_02695 [Ignavibacteriaceae bacterium]|nr:hypothetical protein [Ignavibacteriaceae bacterium]